MASATTTSVVLAGHEPRVMAERSGKQMTIRHTQAVRALPQRSMRDPIEMSSDLTNVRAARSSGVVAGTVPGSTVYLNDPTPGQTPLYPPGANQRIADDLVLINEGCSVTGFEVFVAGLAEVGSPPTFDVQFELWNGEPCQAGSAVIAGTQTSVVGVPNDQSIQLLQVALNAPVVAPQRVWLALTFSTDDSGWVVGQEPELGATETFWSENDTTLGCGIYVFNSGMHGGFTARVRCDYGVDPTGACCDGETCSVVTESACPGLWHGPGSTCDPDPCTPTFLIYRNEHPTTQFFAPAGNERTADDIQATSGVPCELAYYRLSVVGVAGSGPFDTTVELWSADPADGSPLAAIPGTMRVFTGVPADGIPRTLVTDLFSGVTVTDLFWLVVRTSTADSGWMISGEADIGFTADLFGLDDGLAPPNNTWSLFDFTDPTIWSGMNASVACYGSTPTGSCCNDAAATCADAVLETQCDGRWLEGITCARDRFAPSCGTVACCAELGCTDVDIATCDAIGGMPVFGTTCAAETIDFTCPRIDCFGATGDCRSLAGTGTPGCDDVACCDAVCQGDAFCCTTEWDNLCAETALTVCAPLPLANDHCTNAEPIAGEGTFNFDTTQATTDGQPHAGCVNSGEDGQITSDVWYDWTSTCSGQVVVRTCGLTTVDTKLAAYSFGEACPPSDLSLLTCDDDTCPSQSMLVFDAQIDGRYLIRLGTFPGGNGLDRAPGGPGQFSISCGPPNNVACTAGVGDCCTPHAAGEGACNDEACCELVCACDPFCCEVEWDDTCAGSGAGGTGCGAEALCGNLCSVASCPAGPVNFASPLDGSIDARQPFAPDDGSVLQGTSTLIVEAPAGAQSSCWTLCETGISGAPNGIVNVTEDTGTYTITLERPITPGQATTLTYTEDGGVATTGEFIAHPGNVDGSATSSPDDIAAAIACVTDGTCEIWQCDIDRSGSCAPSDILREIDVLNGADQLDPWDGTTLPSAAGVCP